MHTSASPGAVGNAAARPWQLLARGIAHPRFFKVYIDVGVALELCAQGDKRSTRVCGLARHTRVIQECIKVCVNTGNGVGHLARPR